MHNANVLKYLRGVIASVFQLHASEASALMPLLQHRIPFACIQISGFPMLEAAGWDSPQLRHPTPPLHLIFITPMKGFIKTTANNLLDF